MTDRQAAPIADDSKVPRWQAASAQCKENESASLMLGALSSGSIGARLNRKYIDPCRGSLKQRVPGNSPLIYKDSRQGSSENQGIDDTKIHLRSAQCRVGNWLTTREDDRSKIGRHVFFHDTVLAILLDESF